MTTTTTMILMIDDWWCYYIYICYYCYEHSTVWTIAFFTSWCCCCGGMPLLHWHDRNHWRLFPYVVGLFALRCLDEAFQGAKRKWTLSPKFIGHHPGSVFFQNAELKQIWSDQTNPTYTNMFSNLVDASPHFGRRGLCRRWHQKKTISDEPPSAMTPTVKFQDGRIDWRNRSLQEPSSPGNFAWNLLTWSSLNTWEFDFQYFYQKSQCPLVPSSFPDYCSVQHLCEPPRIKHIGGGLFSIHLCATTTPKARTGFSAFLAVPDSRVIQRNGKNGRTFPRRSAASFVWVGHIAIAWISGRSRGTSSLRRAACWNLGHQSAM